MTRFDVGIIGLGAMGSMAALELARRGHSVVGFDRFRPPHPFGSSHGKSRIIREAYFEHPQYVPLVQRAYELWADLEQWSGEQLLRPTGGLMLGPPAGALLSGARRSAILHHLSYEELSPPELGSRFPMFSVASHERGLWEPRAGVLFPERAIEAALRLAAAAGAELHFDEPATTWTTGEAVTIRARNGHWRAERLILSAGSWLSGLAQYPLPLSVARQALFWFATEDPAAAAAPIFIWEWEPGRMFYGFPDFGDGVKLAIHHEGEATDPEQVRRTVYPEEAAQLRAVFRERLPLVGEAIRQTAVCLYTNTPDGDFIVDRHPADPRVVLASPCSGHGFKFCPALGEVLADLVEEKQPRFDLTPFRLSRFGTSG